MAGGVPRGLESTGQSYPYLSGWATGQSYPYLSGWASGRLGRGAQWSVVQHDAGQAWHGKAWWGRYTMHVDYHRTLANPTHTLCITSGCAPVAYCHKSSNLPFFLLLPLPQPNPQGWLGVPSHLKSSVSYTVLSAFFPELCSHLGGRACVLLAGLAWSTCAPLVSSPTCCTCTSGRLLLCQCCTGRCTAS